MTEQPPAPGRPDIETICRRVRTIAGIAALAAVTIAVVALMVMAVSLYPSLRATVQNVERASEAVAISTEILAGISDEAALNLLESTANLNRATANLESISEESRLGEVIVGVLNRTGLLDPS